jgi:hypothetical protein
MVKTTKLKKDIEVAIRIIAKQFNEREVYSGIDIKNKIEEFYPGVVEFDKKEEKQSKPYKKTGAEFYDI